VILSDPHNPDYTNPKRSNYQPIFLKYFVSSWYLYPAACPYPIQTNTFIEKKKKKNRMKVESFSYNWVEQSIVDVKHTTQYKIILIINTRQLKTAKYAVTP